MPTPFSPRLWISAVLVMAASPASAEAIEKVLHGFALGMPKAQVMQLIADKAGKPESIQCRIQDIRDVEYEFCDAFAHMPVAKFYDYKVTDLDLTFQGDKLHRVSIDLDWGGDAHTKEKALYNKLDRFEQRALATLIKAMHPVRYKGGAGNSYNWVRDGMRLRFEARHLGDYHFPAPYANVVSLDVGYENPPKPAPKKKPEPKTWFEKLKASFS